jgi:hypothetical protein
MSKNGIQNAGVVIEAFGGIRPMAKKIDVAVTTVQGWKKRNVIPATRRDQILEAAQEHDIDLGDILGGAPVANENVSQAEEAPAEAPVAAVEVSEPEASDEQEGDVIPEEVVSASRDEAPKTAEEKVEAYHADSFDAKPSSAFKVTIILAIIVTLGFVAIAAYFWQKANEERAEAARIQALEEKISQMEQETEAEKQGFLGNIIPKDLSEQITKLQEQAETLQQDVTNAAKTAQETAKLAQEKTREIQEDVLAQDAGNLTQRMTALETHLQDITGQPVLSGMLNRVQGLQTSPEGSALLNDTVGELGALFEVLDIPSVGAAPDAAINDTLDVARSQSDALGATFSSVPKDDLKAAALLLVMSQLRESLNRDNDAFDSDLALLKKLVGEDSPELIAALDRLSPQASEGVLTPAGLSDELRTFAGDAVVASLSGEDVSVKERASARMNDIFQVEKNGELITGTDTQASLARADQLLQNGDIEGAIAAVEGLDGDAATAMAPWLNKATISLNAQKAKKIVADLIDGTVAGGTYINNKETGINIYVPPSAPATTAP